MNYYLNIFLSAFDAWLTWIFFTDISHCKWERIEFWAALNGAITPWKDR